MKKVIQRAGYKECFFETKHVKINYVRGPNTGEPLLLFPGQTMPWQSYQRVLPQLAKHFQVYAIDVHGHGKSSWTPKRYTFDLIGQDMALFLKKVVQRPAFVSGNSSGGIIALWLAANEPDWVKGVIAEDPPLFSSEWPRLRDNCFVHYVFSSCIKSLCSPKGRDVAGVFRDFEVPVKGKQTPMKLPRFFSWMLSWYIRLYRLFKKEGSLDLPLVPLHARVFIQGLSEYDPAFTQGFLDGSAVKGFDHASMLEKIQCPMLLLHATWFYHDRYGLVGAMDDDDVEKTRSLILHFEYSYLPTSHVIHMSEPKQFTNKVIEFCERILKKTS